MDRKDVLTTPPVDHCYHEPCMRHGVCLSRADRYECHCAARYSGNNCQLDNGPPCNSDPCLNGGHCEETKQGDYVCTCSQGYYGYIISPIIYLPLSRSIYGIRSFKRMLQFNRIAGIPILKLRKHKNLFSIISKALLIASSDLTSGACVQ